MAKGKKSKLTFEEMLKNLEQKVNELEQGNMPLDEMLQKFSEGIELAKECEIMLNQGEDSIWN